MLHLQPGSDAAQRWHTGPTICCLLLLPYDEDDDEDDEDDEADATRTTEEGKDEDGLHRCSFGYTKAGNRPENISFLNLIWYYFSLHHYFCI